ncbi:MAG: DUF2520 domain-containing protein [Deltaproteobacteria bacterium]|nr:DUF2520 domain-containing protein [Deltaproteobacteria bacterium]
MVKKIAVIGLGNVGTVMALALQNAGCEVVAVCARSRETLVRNGRAINAIQFLDAADAAEIANVILITTNDDSIRGVCEQIAKANVLATGDVVLHLSGAGSLDLLATARERGAGIACIHPIQTFTNTETSLASIPHTTFGVTCDDEMFDWCYDFVALLGGTPIRVPEPAKALYHAASCFTSAYISTLLFLVEEIYGAIGMDSAVARKAYLPLLHGTIANIVARGPVSALSGPIARGDLHTIGNHLGGFRNALPQLLPIYCALGLHALEIAQAKGTISEEQAQRIKIMLEGVNK